MVQKVTLDEIREAVGQATKEVLREYLDKNLMGPLYGYLKRTRKKYDQKGFNKLYHDYQLGKTDITTRRAFTNPQVFKNGWVVHFTNSPYEILTNGFRGVARENMEYIWRTFGRMDIMGPGYSDEGYAFAFDANEIGRNSIDYGDYALIFRVSGVKVNNLGDLGQSQVIFNSKMADLKQCFILTFNTNSESSYNGNGDMDTVRHLSGVSVINPYTKKAVFKAGDIQTAVKWVEENYQQYSGANVFNQMPKIKEKENELQAKVDELVNYVKKYSKGHCEVSQTDFNKGWIITNIRYDEGTFNIRLFKQYANYLNSNGELDIAYSPESISIARRKGTF